MSPWAEIVVGLLLLASGAVVLTAGLGLWRLPDFFARMHAPALAATLAAWIVTLASILHFSLRDGGLALHAWLVIIVLSITAPVTTMVLARAGLFRGRQAGSDLPPPLARGPEGITPHSRPAPPPPHHPAAAHGPGRARPGH